MGYEQGHSIGYTEGYADGQSNTGEIVYTYHSHGDGYCKEVPVYHAHTAKSGSCYTPIYCGASLRKSNEANGYKYFCSNYTDGEADYHWFGTSHPNPGGNCPHIDGYSLTCGKTTSTIDGYKCTLDSTSIVFATIAFN